MGKKRKILRVNRVLNLVEYHFRGFKTKEKALIQTYKNEREEEHESPNPEKTYLYGIDTKLYERRE